LLTAYKLGYSGLLCGGTASGKSSLARELAACLGAMYRVKGGSPDISLPSLTAFLKGVASSGCWATIEDIDRAQPQVLGPRLGNGDLVTFLSMSIRSSL
jgi:hypothetical protein